MRPFDFQRLLQDKVFFVVEAGCNYENDLEKAKEMIRVAAQSGADAIKFQTFIAEKLMSKHAEKFWDIQGCPGETALEEFRQLPHLTIEQYIELKTVAYEAGILFFSTPEDEISFGMLDSIQVPMWKISSMNITHKPLITACAKTQKPILVSTGASTIGEIAQAVEWIEQAENNSIAILHCISNYPTIDENVNLRMIQHLEACFPNHFVGYSDHTIPENGDGILAAAVALGARVIEKHFTWDNSRPGYDHQISIDYHGLKNLIIQIRRTEKSLGAYRKIPIQSEDKARVHARRSLYAGRNITKGSVITRDMIEIKRPLGYIAPYLMDHIIGRRAKQDIEMDTAIKWDMV